MKKNQYCYLGVNIMLIAIVLITLISVLVPFAPNLPNIGLDPSWRFAMNQTVAQGLSFGKDLIFTFGPYASIYTREYHPITDSVMLAGSFYLALSYCMAIAVLIMRERWCWTIVLCGVLAWMPLPDTLFFLYPLLAALALIKMLSLKESTYENNRYVWLLSLFLFAPFGLLPLIKGSLLMPCSMISLCCCCFCVSNNKKFFAIISIVVPLISMVLFWLLSGQSLINLPEYIASMSLIASGYTEAMMLNGNKLEIFLYLFSSLLLLVFIMLQRKVSLISRLFLLFAFGLFFFIAFKAGFVRHDGHAMIAATAILAAAALLPFIFNSKRIPWLIIISALICYIIESHYVMVRPLITYNHFVETYSAAWRAASRRIQDKNWPKMDFERAMFELKTQAHFPVLPGTTDDYSYDQALLIASGNTWSPRPIFQSYLVYTPALAEKNKNHLVGAAAPDNVIFKVEPIDGRLPSLEDGASWPILLADYEPTKFSEGFLFLKKKNAINQPAELITVFSKQYSLGETVSLPDREVLLFAEAKIKLSLIGRLADFLFKPSRLKITLHLQDGTTKEENIIAGMTQTEFLISPFIENTAEFKSLYDGGSGLDGNKVLSFSIYAPKYDFCWKNKYTLLLKKMVAPSPDISY